MNTQDLMDRIQKGTKKETRSKRMNLLVTPAQHIKLKQIAQLYETSVNDLMGNIFDQLIEDHEKQLELIEKQLNS